tara:strand:+ start:889 stop:1353 length:465 start_codon:yes stop_codon:yes gene_type:complete
METKKTSSASIILLNLKHLDACINLDKAALEGFWSRSQWEKELSNPKAICFGTIKSYELIAFICSWKIADQLDINTIAVHPLHQKQGLGEMLLRAIISKAEFEGIKKVTLEVKTTNYAAKCLYKKIGFKITGERIKYYKDGSNALILNLTLPKT